MTELEKAAIDYSRERLSNDDYPVYNDEYEIELAFEAGVEWQYEQFEKERLKHCDELTAEQAQIESDFVVQHLEKYNRTPTFIDAIEYGRRLMIDKAVEWLKDNIHYDDFSGNMEWYVPFADDDEMVEDFKKFMED